MLWALGQPAAAIGLGGAFLLGLVLRTCGQVLCARAVGVRAAFAARDQVDPVGAVAVVLGGTGWGRGALVLAGSVRQRALVLFAGPLCVLLAGEAGLALFGLAFPGDRRALALNRPSDVLRGVVAPNLAEQVVLSVVVGLVCFGLVALVPVPPTDGFRLLRLASFPDRPGSVVADRIGVLALLLLLVVPVAGSPPLLAALDLVGTPLVRAWS